MTCKRLPQFILASMLAAVTLGYLAPATASDSNKWRIAVNHNAHSDGELVFRVHPKGGEPQDLTVQITKGTGENDVARAIRDSFRAQLPADAYHVETDDGEDVLVKKRHGAANFNLMLVSTTVENVKFKIKKE